jgi:broad specificity phosphatase PhoE
MKGQPFCPDQAAAAVAQQLPNHLAPLTELGQRQAEELGKRLAEKFESFQLLIHSGYRRAEQTAEIVIEHLTPRPTVVADLQFRERDPGYSYAMVRQEFHQRFPWMQEYWDRTGWFFARPIGGESLSDVLYNRAIPSLKEVISTNIGKRVLIISHGRFIQVARLWLEQHAVTGPVCPVPSLPNCGYVGYQWSWKNDPLRPISD